MKVILSQPIHYKDSQLEALDLDLDSLTGRDIIAVEDSLRTANQNVVMFSQGYFAAVAARASHLPLDVIRNLGVKDFMNVTTQVMNFLLASVSETSQPGTSDE